MSRSVRKGEFMGVVRAGLAYELELRTPPLLAWAGALPRFDAVAVALRAGLRRMDARMAAKRPVGRPRSTHLGVCRVCTRRVRVRDGQVETHGWFRRGLFDARCEGSRCAPRVLIELRGKRARGERARVEAERASATLELFA